ncbi:LOW QUALITY PROTEIN: TKTL2-like protein [Mya arenaria]|uniref:transketolase n=1 Tax=Mya arenaria TaxID=6604 RepID=A0ABY7FSW7_MYAAR|nr:LOW QUALITY PROTEIN: TKTL2-like protein [Mya arenaria]
MLQHEMDVYEARLKAFGWNTYVVDGHDVEVLCKTLHDATTVHVKDKPTCILAKTFKGKGFPGIEDQINWHGKVMGTRADELIKTLKDNMSKQGPINLRPQTITATVPKSDISNIRLAEPPNYEMGQQVAHPKRFIECYIAEQNLVWPSAVPPGTVAFCSTFAAFFTRAFDQIRMGAISQTNVNFVGSHAGISLGFDGSSQMGLEDLAMFGSIPGSTVFYPSDAVSCERAVKLAANTPGICYIRTSSLIVPVINRNDELFQVGKAKVVRRSDSDKVTVISCCVTLLEATRAADKLTLDGINIRIIDPFTLKPLDRDTILSNAKETGGRIITVEDHYEWGGLGEAVAGALSEERDICIKRLAVQEVPHSSKPAELIEKYGISANCIVKAVNCMLFKST